MSVTLHLFETPVGPSTKTTLGTLRHGAADARRWAASRAALFGRQADVASETTIGRRALVTLARLREVNEQLLQATQRPARAGQPLRRQHRDSRSKANSRAVMAGTVE